MASNRTSETTREKIITATARVIRTQGVSRMTLSEVAAEAGISKGGLLYHFGTKELLIRGMLEHSLKAFDRAIEHNRKDDRSPGSWLRAYIGASFPNRDSELQDQSMIGAAIIASVSSEIYWLEPYRICERRWAKEALADGVPPLTAQLIRIAIDGLWLQLSLGIEPLTPKEQQDFLCYLVELTRGHTTPITSS